MKNVAGKTLIFYYFQLDSNKDYNVTTLATGPQPPTIKDVLATLPLDLSHGLYHFRFKSQLPDGEDKTIAWIDINNLGAKVPQVNGSIYMKILKLKDSSHNKLFHIDKLKKAEIVKAHSHSHSLQPSHVNSTPRSNLVTPSPQVVKIQQIPIPTQNPVKNPSASQGGKTSPGANKISSSPSGQQKAKIITPTPPPAPPKQRSPPSTKRIQPPNSNFISFDKHPELSQQTKQKLQVFDDQIREEQMNRQNQKIAQEELQDIIRKWGYTDGKKINNTPTLMATLHQIWPEWEAVSLTDMLKPEQVTALFKKAVIKVHPDKNRHRHFKEKYLSKRVFELLNESRKQ